MIRHLALAIVTLGLFGLGASAVRGDDVVVGSAPGVTAVTQPATVVPVRWYRSYYGPYYGYAYRPYWRSYYYGPRWYPGYAYYGAPWGFSYSGPYVQFGFGY